MTYEDALKAIGEFVPSTRIDNVNKLDAIMKAMEALKKQIPQKPKNCGSIGSKSIYTYGYCPNCGSGCNYEMRYCSECGQRLDWSEEPKDIYDEAPLCGIKESGG